jgi:hypothetical protein
MRFHLTHGIATVAAVFSLSLAFLAFLRPALHRTPQRKVALTTSGGARLESFFDGLRPDPRFTAGRYPRPVQHKQCRQQTAGVVARLAASFRMASAVHAANPPYVDCTPGACTGCGVYIHEKPDACSTGCSGILFYADPGNPNKSAGFTNNIASCTSGGDNCSCEYVDCDNSKNCGG